MKKTFFWILILFVPIFSNAESPSQVSVKVQVETYQGKIFDDAVNVAPCSDNQDETTESLNAFCAIEEVASLKNWTVKKTWYSFGASLDGLSDFESDFANNRFWLYFVNDAPGEVALNSYILKEGDKLLLTYGTSPLKISALPQAPTENSTTTIAASYFDVNNWLWQTANNVVFSINGVNGAAEEDGILELFIESGSSYQIIAKISGYIDSNLLNISTKSTNSSNNNQTVGGVWIPPVPPKDFSLSDAIAFVANMIDDNGSFGADMFDDWAAIALGALEENYDIITDKVRQYIISHPLQENAILTDYERRAMALMALNKNPWKDGGLNYIEKILKSYDGKQFGDPALSNDDIFAIIPLIRAGIAPSDERIISSANYIINFQNSSGSFGSPDLTAAAIQAMLLVPPSEKIYGAIENGKKFFRNSQNDDGGWGNSFSTSWVLQAIYALGDNPENWKKENSTPLNYIGAHQADDGGLEQNKEQKLRLWATVYAIPAFLGKPWVATLKSFTEEKAEGRNVVSTENADDKISLPKKDAAEIPNKAVHSSPTPLAPLTRYWTLNENKIMENSSNAASLALFGNQSYQKFSLSKIIIDIFEKIFW